MPLPTDAEILCDLMLIYNVRHPFIERLLHMPNEGEQIDQALEARRKMMRPPFLTDEQWNEIKKNRAMEKLRKETRHFMISVGDVWEEFGRTWEVEQLICVNNIVNLKIKSVADSGLITPLKLIKSYKQIKRGAGPEMMEYSTNNWLAEPLDDLADKIKPLTYKEKMKEPKKPVRTFMVRVGDIWKRTKRTGIIRSHVITKITVTTEDGKFGVLAKDAAGDIIHIRYHELVEHYEQISSGPHDHDATLVRSTKYLKPPRYALTEKESTFQSAPSAEILYDAAAKRLGAPTLGDALKPKKEKIPPPFELSNKEIGYGYGDGPYQRNLSKKIDNVLEIVQRKRTNNTSKFNAYVLRYEGEDLCAPYNGMDAKPPQEMRHLFQWVWANYKNKLCNNRLAADPKDICLERGQTLEVGKHYLAVSKEGEIFQVVAKLEDFKEFK